MQRSIGWRVGIFVGHIVQAVHLVGDIFTGSLRTNDAGNICSPVSPLHNYEEERQRESLRHPSPCCDSFKLSGSSVLVPFELRFHFLSLQFQRQN